MHVDIGQVEIIGLQHVYQKLLLDFATRTANKENKLQRTPCNRFKLGVCLSIKAVNVHINNFNAA